MDNTQFIDPLEELMSRVSKTEPSSEPISDAVEATSEMANQTSDADDEYGVNDLASEIAREEEADAEERALRAAQSRIEREQEEAKKVAMPPISIDKEYQNQAITFQATTLDIVGQMIDEVVKKNNLPVGGIPVSTDDDPELQRHIMGELVSIYHVSGTTITPEFEQLIIRNWVPAEVQPEEPKQETQDAVETTETVASDNQMPSQEPPTINISVEKGSPVTVNVDQDVVQAMTTTNQINIIVKEVTQQELMSSKVIHNSQQAGIIEPYVAELGDVPLTLPLSAYRCTLKPVNYYEFIQLGSTPMSGNSVDQDKKQWSIIYDHIKNVSIGEFKDFEDFLKKTKYGDRELLMWGILIGAADDEETVPIRCSNPKCKKVHSLKYRPRTIIHVDDELMKEYQYETTHTVGYGQPAIDHYNKINSTLKRYKLPNTGFIVEIDDRPSAYDFLNRRYPLMNALEKRFYPDGRTDDTEENPEHGYLLTHALFITAISIIKKNNKGEEVEYRFDDWDDIEKIITTSLDMKDQAILLNLIQTIAKKTASPMQFYIENFTCDNCGHHDDRIIIPDIGEDLIFQLARRLSSTEINLIGMESN